MAGEIDMERERWKRDNGMRRAAEAAGDEFARNAWSCLRYLASKPDEFNSDDLRETMLARELVIERPLALGQIFATASRKGLIVKTGNRRQTRTEGGHLRDYPLYRGRGW